MAEHTPSVLFPSFMEAVHIELTDEAVHVPVPEVLRENDLLKLIDILYDELSSIS